MYSLESIERKRNIKFPEEYKRLYESNFKGIDNQIEIHAEKEVFYIIKFLSATEVNDIWEEFYDFFGYDIVPIAETKYGDYICLYYRENKKKPSIIYWNYELALEKSDEGVLPLYDDMKEFEANLK